MPSRKRANWRHPVVYDEDGATGRRTTRAATGLKRSSVDGSRSQHPSASGSSSHAASGGGANYYVRRERDGTIINISTSRKRAKRWIEVHRPPGPGIRFTVPMWVSVDDLTSREREQYLPPSTLVDNMDDQQEMDESESEGESDNEIQSPEKKRRKLSETESHTESQPSLLPRPADVSAEKMTTAPPTSESGGSVHVSDLSLPIADENTAQHHNSAEVEHATTSNTVMTDDKPGNSTNEVTNVGPLSEPSAPPPVAVETQEASAIDHSQSQTIIQQQSSEPVLLSNAQPSVQDVVVMEHEPEASKVPPTTDDSLQYGIATSAQDSLKDREDTATKTSNPDADISQTT